MVNIKIFLRQWYVFNQNTFCGEAEVDLVFPPTLSIIRVCAVLIQKDESKTNQIMHTFFRHSSVSIYMQSKYIFNIRILHLP